MLMDLDLDLDLDNKYPPKKEEKDIDYIHFYRKKGLRNEYIISLSIYYRCHCCLCPNLMIVYC